MEYDTIVCCIWYVMICRLIQGLVSNYHSLRLLRHIRKNPQGYKYLGEKQYISMINERERKKVEKNRKCWLWRIEKYSEHIYIYI